MEPDRDPFSLAGAASEPTPPLPDTAKELFPVTFEKDDLDFRGIPVEDEPVIPKASSVPASVVTPSSVTGLEDVSKEDLGENVQPNVAKDTTLRLASG